MGLRTRNLKFAVLALAGLIAAGGCTLHRNLLLRWHLEFDADNVPDQCVPGCVDNNCGRCGKISKLGGACPAQGRVRAEGGEVGPVPGPTPAQLGLARFHPVPTRPVFNMPDEAPPASSEPPLPTDASPRMVDPHQGPLTPEEMRSLEEVEGIPVDTPRESRRTK